MYSLLYIIRVDIRCFTRNKVSFALAGRTEIEVWESKGGCRQVTNDTRSLIVTKLTASWLDRRHPGLLTRTLNDNTRQLPPIIPVLDLSLPLSNVDDYFSTSDNCQQNRQMISRISIL